MLPTSISTSAGEWAAEMRARLSAGSVPLVAPELVAVRDLELVDPALAAGTGAAGSTILRAALIEPTRVLLADGRYADVPSYTSWWLRNHPVLGGRRPAICGRPARIRCSPACTTRPVCPRTPRSHARSAVRTSLAELLAEPGGADELLNRLADPGDQSRGRSCVRSGWRWPQSPTPNLRIGCGPCAGTRLSSLMLPKPWFSTRPTCGRWWLISR